MLRKVSFFLIFCFLVYILFFSLVSADQVQDRIDQLRQQIQALEEQSQKYRQDINRTRQEGESLKQEIASLNSQLNQLLVQIRITSNKITTKELEIQQLQSQMGDLLLKIDESKLTISQLIREINELDNVSLLAMLFKYAQLSEIFNQYEQTSNIQQELLTKIEELKDFRDELNVKKGDAEVKQQDLENLKSQQQAERSTVNGAKSQKDNLLKITKGQEVQYQKLLVDIEKKKTEFFKELQQLELQARGKGEFIVHVTAKSIPPRGTKIFQWPEAVKRLTQGYGMTAFARRGAYGGAPHNGIDMAIGFGSELKAIGSGVILASGNNNGWGNWVAVRHDNDLVSLYGHMSTPTFLKVGQRVSPGTVIGYEGATGNVTGSHLHLSLYRDFFTYISEKTGQLYFNYFEGTLNPLDYL
ncbi:MAG: peptidoglycan DD-metalloendopeptidase family protein [Parcubacteria group bacterium]|nr:peptidoglycan DD-metalloendopeptidase family protein [Parcubacteria group bacterium]